MLTTYDDCDLAVVVFNRYGDIVYTNHLAESMVVSNHIAQIPHKKIRLMAESLLVGLTLAPLTFHATTAGQSVLFCHIHRLHNSYTLIWNKISEYDYALNSNISKLPETFYHKISRL